MGSPSWEGPCDTFGVSRPHNGCTHEIGYRSWLAPVLPVYWVIELDQKDRVIDEYVYASP